MHSALSNEATRKSTMPHREPNEKVGVRYAVTGCYFLKWKELHITNMKVNNILENIVLLEKIELKAIHI
jgi:hypothetical protein